MLKDGFSVLDSYVIKAWVFQRRPHGTTYMYTKATNITARIYVCMTQPQSWLFYLYLCVWMCVLCVRFYTYECIWRTVDWCIMSY